MTKLMHLMEDKSFEVGLLTEKTADGKEIKYIEGIFAQAEKKNRNDRIYPKSVLESSIEDYIRDFVIPKRAHGELNHPLDRFSVDPHNVCIRVVHLEWHGDDVYGKASIITSNPAGAIVAGIYEDGGILGVSTRGMGSVYKNGVDTLVEAGYEIGAIDVVHNPSGIDCYVNGINESISWVKDNGKFVQVQENIIRNTKNGSERRYLLECVHKMRDIAVNALQK